MKTILGKITLLSATLLACTPPAQNGSAIRSTSGVSSTASLMGEYFAPNSFKAHLECNDISVETPMAWDSSLGFPSQAASFALTFNPTIILTGQNCFVRITATLQNGAENKIEWLAQKNGELEQNLLYLSELAPLTNADSTGTLSHSAKYYQTFNVILANPNPSAGGTNTGIGTGASGSVNTGNSASNPPSGTVPFCTPAATIDTNGDGWGYENGQSCLVQGGVADTSNTASAH